MSKFHLEPNVVSYNTAMGATATADAWQMTLELFQHDGTEGDQISYSSAMTCGRFRWRGVQIGGFCGKTTLEGYNPVIAAAAAASTWDIAIQLFEEMPKADCFSYTALTTACARTSQWQKALLLWTEMFQMQVESSDISYNAVMSACEKGGQWELSLQLFDDVADSCQITRRRPYVSSC
eukprot:symbB.v1.2.000907.t1/scaffold27.1/size414596/15